MSIFSELLDAYNSGKNISQYLRDNRALVKAHGLLESDLIELSYDLQAGSYVKSYYSNYDKCQCFNKYIFDLLKSNGVFDELSLNSSSVRICDFGTGESTNLISLLNIH